MTVVATSPSVEQLVAVELDALPDWLLAALERVPVVVCPTAALASMRTASTRATESRATTIPTAS